MPTPTLKQIATNPSQHIMFSGKFYDIPFEPGSLTFKDLPCIKGCACNKNLLPINGSIRTDLMGSVKNYCKKQVENMMPAAITFVGAGYLFEVLQVIAIAHHAGVSQLELDLFELDFLAAPGSTKHLKVKQSLQELIDYLFNQNVRLVFNSTSGNDKILRNLDINAANNIIEAPILSITMNIFSSVTCNDSLNIVFKNKPSKFIMAVDLVEGPFNPFILLKQLMLTATIGSELHVINKASARVQINPSPFHRNTIFLWQKIKDDNACWIDIQPLGICRPINEFWTGFFARAPEGKGPDVKQLIAQPFGPYYNRYRFNEDFSEAELTYANGSVI